MSVRELYSLRREYKMQLEEQLHPITTPEKLPQADSSESKPKRGGRRPGAGRKPNLAKRLLSGVKPMTAAEALEGVITRLESAAHTTRSFVFPIAAGNTHAV